MICDDFLLSCLVDTCCLCSEPGFQVWRSQLMGFILQFYTRFPRGITPFVQERLPVWLPPPLHWATCFLTGLQPDVPVFPFTTSGTDSHPASWFPAVPFYLLEPHHGLYQLLSLVSQVEGSSNFEISHSRWNYFDHLRFKSETYKLETKGQLILQGNAVWITNPYKNKNICLFDMWSFIFS
jgi:hypothetical protein